MTETEEPVGASRPLLTLLMFAAAAATYVAVAGGLALLLVDGGGRASAVGYGQLARALFDPLPPAFESYSRLDQWPEPVHLLGAAVLLNAVFACAIALVCGLALATTSLGRIGTVFDWPRPIVSAAWCVLLTPCAMQFVGYAGGAILMAAVWTLFNHFAPARSLWPGDSRHYVAAGVVLCGLILSTWLMLGSLGL